MTYLLVAKNTLKTGLKVDGNQHVLKCHKNFLSKTELPIPTTDDIPRVIVQGFSLFKGIESNISGAVVDTLAELPYEQRGMLLEKDFGARLTQKVIEISGRKVELCLVVNEVQWDLAAANLIAIADSFKPNIILMSGLGGKKAILETGARNLTSTFSGFNSNGENLENNNRPYSKKIDLNSKNSKIIHSTWNFQKIYKSIAPLIDELGFDLALAEAGRKENNYICNNIHYSILHAIKYGDINLARNLIKQNLSLNFVPAAGFFHYPSKSLSRNPSENELALENWSKVIKEIIASQLGI